MATSSSQDGGRKRKKPPRPLIAPALPRSFKPQPTTPASELASAPHTSSNATVAHSATAIKREAFGATRIAQEVDTNSSPSPGSEQHAGLNSVTQTAATLNNAPSEEQESVLVESAGGKSTSQDTQEYDKSRSVTPKASSRAESLNTQSPAPASASAESHTNGVIAEALQNLPTSIEHLNFQPGSSSHNGSLITGQSAPEQTTVMPRRRYFSSEEPILDWADEMSEEMPPPPDTLHIPPVPHLPELSSDSTASQFVNSQGVPDYEIQPSRPIFGSSAAQELHSEPIASETPKRNVKQMTNGYSHIPEPKAAISDHSTTPYQTAQASIPLQNGHVQTVSQPFLPRRPMADINTHLTKIFETRDLADWTIQVVPPNGTYPPVAYPSHGVIISRSEVLRYLMGIRLHARPMTAVITLSPPRYVLPPAFEAALNYLYNDATLTPTECARYFAFNADNTRITVKNYQMDFCFSYWLSGHILGLAAVVEAGLELLKEYLDWDTAEMMIKESLEVKNAQNFASSPNGAILTPSSANETPSPIAFRQKTITATGIDELDILAVLLTSIESGKLVVDLSEFNLDTGHPHVLQSYLPDVQQNIKSNRALASITFGSLPTTTSSTSKTHARLSKPVFSSSNATDTQTFSPTEQALSAILLNVPFTELNELFKGLLQSFADDDVLDLFTKVIQERELRRIRVAESDWYRSEVSAKRRLQPVDSEEELIRDGMQSYLVSRLAE